jgi:hypothetical protein
VIPRVPIRERCHVTTEDIFLLDKAILVPDNEVPFRESDSVPPPTTSAPIRRDMHNEQPHEVAKTVDHRGGTDIERRHYMLPRRFIELDVHVLRHPSLMGHISQSLKIGHTPGECGLSVLEVARDNLAIAVDLVHDESGSAGV